MRRMIPLIMTVGLAVSAQTLACDAPGSDPAIPDGKSATREAMVEAQKAVRALDGAVKAYAACLEDKQRKEPQGAAGYARQQNDEVARLQKVAERFNRELRAFKAQNAG